LNAFLNELVENGTAFIAVKPTNLLMTL